MAYASNLNTPRTQEAEAGEPQVPGKPGLHGTALSLNERN